MKTQASGAALVGIASILWATDALFRVPALARMNPVMLVFLEHSLALAAMLPFAILVYRRRLFSLTPSAWAAAAGIGAGASAMATVFFTSSFKFLNPSVVILLQKLQPVICVLLAMLFLKERPGRRFFLWAPVALVAGLVLSFPGLDLGFVRGAATWESSGVIYALAAAVLWAGATVAGKVLLAKTSPFQATFWRFFFGMLTLLVLMLTAGTQVFESGAQILSDGQNLKTLAYMSLVPGLAAMIAYYAGLAKTRASIATFVELLFPLAAVFVNWKWLGSPLSGGQLVAGAILLVSVTVMAE